MNLIGLFGEVLRRIAARALATPAKQGRIPARTNGSCGIKSRTPLENVRACSLRADVRTERVLSDLELSCVCAVARVSRDSSTSSHVMHRMSYC